MKRTRPFSYAALLIAGAAIVLHPIPAYAYIAPAIGLISYLLGPVAALIGAVALILIWPLKILWRWWKRKTGRTEATLSSTPENEADESD